MHMACACIMQMGKSEEPCILHIKNYHKCMVFYEELPSIYTSCNNADNTCKHMYEQLCVQC